METTLLTIEFLNNTSCYYFDCMETGRIRIFWHEKFIKSFDNLQDALIWFIQNKFTDSVKVNNYIK